MTRKRIKISPVLIAINLLILILIVVFYTTRLVKYYVAENGNDDKDAKILLVDKIIKKQSYVDLTTGLIFDEEKNIYRYKGQVEDNYLLYSGILYRVIAIDNENNIRLVSDKSLTLMYSGLENGFEKSYINKWLNLSDEKHSGIFENTMYEKNDLLSYTYMCDDTIEDLLEITCNENNNEYKITTLSLYDYFEAGGKESYLNNGEAFYLNTLNTEKNNYYISAEGEVGINDKTTKIYGLRPVITINSNALLIDGKGTKDNPYIIEKHDISTLKDLYIGDIIKLSDQNFKVLELLDDKIKVVSVDAITNGENKIEQQFDKSSNRYSAKNSIGTYLNGTYFKSLEESKYIVNSPWYILMPSISDLDYASKYNDKVNANIGMLSISDLFIGDVYNVFTITGGMESSNIINVINEEGKVFGDLVTKKYNVRPSFYLKSNVSITSGKGTIAEPYVLGEINEEKE
ncbi:MAG: hypothetical protein GX758_04345 [Tenericutes bacterium]|nr:hypothetical protein [Mycoplasmatota bacterium]